MQFTLGADVLVSDVECGTRLGAVAYLVCSRGLENRSCNAESVLRGQLLLEVYSGRSSGVWFAESNAVRFRHSRTRLSRT